MNVLDRLSPGYNAFVALFAAASLDHAKFLAAGPDALKAHLATLAAPPADVAAAVEAATAQLQARLAQAEQAAASAQAQAAALNTGIAAAGITVPPGATAEQVTTLVRDRASVLAQEKLATHHLEAPLPVTPAADVTRPGGPQQMSLGEFRALGHAARSAFLRAGGRLTD